MAMTDKKVFFPKNLNAPSLLSFSEALSKHENAIAIELDFDEAKWMPPFFLLMAASEINRFKALSPKTRITCSNFAGKSYAAHMGFFQAFGLQFGNHPGQANGNENYQPIKVLWADQIRREAANAGVEPGAIMERHAEDLARIMCKTLEPKVLEALTFAIREVLRNAIEHSETDRVALCAQYWPSKNTVEIGVVDWGVGLAASLRKNPNLTVETDEDAVHLSLMPGISGRGAIVSKLRKKTEWTNSGHGLYMISRICRRKGSFLIGSCNAALELRGETVQRTRWAFPGTSARLEIDTSNLEDYSALLDQCRKDSDLFKRAHPDLSLLKPSHASLALARDFSLINA
jgi:hypothetical protein